MFISPTVQPFDTKVVYQASPNMAVCLRKAGQKKPLFLAHCGFGELAYASRLAEEIDSEIPIYGLPGRSIDEDPLRTVEGMAMRMVEMIRAVQPVGPYRVAGWSFGGVLAYEIATQLIAVDQDVEFLGLLELENKFPHEHAYTLAAREYYAKPVPIPVHLFVAESHDTRRGWETIVPADLLRVIPVPGTHHSSMSMADVTTLGQTLSNAICKASYDAKPLAEKNYSPVVTLRFGREDATPLFCVPGAGASVTSFIELIGSLKVEGHICGLQPRGIDGVLIPHSTVSATAESYLRAIRTMYPNGPIHLLGHSFGGWVVFQIAQRFLEAGRSIGSLTLIDSEAPDGLDASFSEYNQAEVILRWIEVFERFLERPLNIQRADLDGRSEAERVKLLHSRMVDQGLLPRQSDPETLRGPLWSFAMSIRTRFKPDQPYPGLMKLILVNDHGVDGSFNQRRHDHLLKEWKHWAPCLTNAVAPGNHLTVLQPPHVSALAQLIQGYATMGIS